MNVSIPNLGEGVDSAAVLSIMVAVGDTIQLDQTILELETAKAVAPIPSPVAGKVEAILVKEGDKVSVGQPVIRLAGDGASASAPAAQPTQSSSAPAQAQAAPSAPSTVSRVSSGAPTEYLYESKSGFPPPTSPSIRKMAADLGIDLLRVKGSANGGRILLSDVKDYILKLQAIVFSGTKVEEVTAAAPAKPAPKSIDFSKWGAIDKKPVSSLRKTIGDNMLQSWNSIPHVTQFEEADITDLLALRKKHNPEFEKQGAKLTVTVFLIKAVVEALKKHPLFNSSYDELTQEMVFKNYYNIGVAVDTESGLMVPVLKNVDQKSLVEVAKELSLLAEKARTRKISLDDMQGGSFTVSNLGGLGGMHFTPIVNKPEVAILGLGRGVLKPVVREGNIEPRTMLPVCVSYDHRFIDGADGARFIKDLVQSFEKFSLENL